MEKCEIVQNDPGKRSQIKFRSQVSIKWNIEGEILARLSSASAELNAIIQNYTYKIVDPMFRIEGCKRLPICQSIND